MRVFLRESLLWYQLELNWLERIVDRRLQELPHDCELMQAGEDDLPLIGELPTLRAEEALLRHRMGATLWLLLDAGLPAFACWTFAGRTPLAGTPEGWLELPHGVAALDDAVVAPGHRGLGLAPRALALIADHYAARGLSALVGKVPESDGAARRRIEQAGFEASGRTVLRRIGLYSRLRFEPFESETPHWLTMALLGHGSAPSAPAPQPAPEPSPRQPQSPLRARR